MVLPKRLIWVFVLVVLSGCMDSSESMLEAEDALLSTTEQACSGSVLELYTEEHFVATDSGAVLHVVERYSDFSQWRHHRRAIMMLTGTFVTNVQYDTDVPGDESYDALNRVAQVGFYGYSVSYEGYGLSSHPADGKIVDADRILDQAGDVLEWIRARTGARRVDVLGTSVGSSVAVALGGVTSPVPLSHVGRLILLSNNHKSVTPLMEQLILSPETQALLLNAPDGYIGTVAPMYDVLLSEATPEALAWGYATFPDTYAVGPTLSAFDLPVFAAEDGRAPALQFWGDQDLVTPYSDVQQFQAEYGGPVDLVVLPGGGHAPTFEPVREQFWARALLFLLLPWQALVH